MDMMESRGNLKYVKKFGSTLHYGQLFNDNHKFNSKEKTDPIGYDMDYHKYGLIWDETGVRFLLDNKTTLYVPVENGFWERGEFEGENPWESGTKMAPFDQEVSLSKILRK